MFRSAGFHSGRAEPGSEIRELFSSYRFRLWVKNFIIKEEKNEGLLPNTKRFAGRDYERY